MRFITLQLAVLYLLLSLATLGCSGLRPSDDALAAHIYTQRRLDQLKSNDLSPVAFEEEVDDSKEESGGGITELPGRFTESIQKATGKNADPEIAKTLYGEGQALFKEATQLQGRERTKKLLSASDKYRLAARRWPDSALEEDALFMVGECNFFADEYPEANDAFERLLKSYPHSRHLDRAEARRFAIARFWLDESQRRNTSLVTVNLTDKTQPTYDLFGNSLRILNGIRLDDPTGKLADDATLAAGNAHFVAGNYIQADEFFTDLRKAYPNSEHQFAAHLLSIKSKLESYDGPEYSGDVLDQAEELIKQIQRQFPAEAKKERDYLARAYGEVRHLQAERDWWMAKYYDRRAENRAARQHYQRIIDDYGETQFVDRARSRIAQLGGKPDKPPERLSWLVNLFPQEERVKPLFGGDGATVRR